MSNPGPFPWVVELIVLAVGSFGLSMAIRTWQNKPYFVWSRSKPRPMTFLDAGSFPSAFMFLFTGVLLPTAAGIGSHSVALAILCWPIFVLSAVIVAASILTIAYLLFRPPPRFLVPPQWRHPK
jgi:hypothetical protein